MLTINGKTNLDYFCDYIHKEISSPVPKRYSIDIPLTDGLLDLTDTLSSEIHFAEREIRITFELRAIREYWPPYYSRIMADLHGKAVEVIFAEDPNYYWKGYASVGALNDNGSTASIVITITADPFKRKIKKETVYDATVTGDVSVSVSVLGQRAYLTFTAGAANMTVTYDGQTWTLDSGESTAFGLVLPNGSNTLTLHGSGDNMKIEMQEGIL